MNCGKPVDTAHYLRDNFERGDRLALVLINKRRDAVIQRIGTTERVAARDVQAWLRYHNSRQYEIYVSMNALREEALGRTKADVGAIRHLYLDFDAGGSPAIERLLNRSDLPRPNYLITTSPEKWQVVWRVEGFYKDQAESLQRSLARELGADPAATDCARVLRIPGFHNHKYTQPYLIRAQLLSLGSYRPDQFPEVRPLDRHQESPSTSSARRAGRPATGLSQSERDWAYAKRALARGESPTLVAAAIAVHRRFEKHNPQYYAELTVRKAADSLGAEKRHAPER